MSNRPSLTLALSVLLPLVIVWALLFSGRSAPTPLASVVQAPVPLIELPVQVFDEVRQEKVVAETVAIPDPQALIDLGARPTVASSLALKDRDPRFIQPVERDGILQPVDKAERAREVERLTAISREGKLDAEAWARANGWPIRGTREGGGLFELMAVHEGQPVYNITQNFNAAISNNVNAVRKSIFNPSAELDGEGWEIGMWEGGVPRLRHQEFYSAPSYAAGFIDISAVEDDPDLAIDDHATHVLGTLLGRGIIPSALGMAPKAQGLCYKWDNATAEMRQDGAAIAGDPGKLYVSNHSWGHNAGWYKYTDGATGPSGNAGWHWLGTAGESEDRRFGAYYTITTSGEDSPGWDRMARRTPYHLAFVAAGNDRGEQPSEGDTAYYPTSTGWTEVTWGENSSLAPSKDGGTTGYDTLASFAVAKNIMTVGNANDAVIGTTRIPNLGMWTSSSFGPTDDGRIKPDIVANGTSVYSAVKSGNADYGNKTGTSMATPSASGAGILLHEKMAEETGGLMMSSTLKALMIHTATDVEAVGPDYKSGWGLLDTQAAVAHIERYAAAPGGRHMNEHWLSTQVSERRYYFQAEAGVPIRATLCWIDPEYGSGGGFVLDARFKRLVNDLDVTLYAPDGTVYQAPQLDYDNPSALATYTGNDRDNVEMLGGSGNLIPTQSGIYELVVSHKGTLREPDRTGTNKFQTFSLILSGNDATTTGTLQDAVDVEWTLQPSGDKSFAYQVDPSSFGGDRALSLPIDDDETAGFEVQFRGPATITFDWGVSSESGYDFLQFLVDDVVVEQISGEVATTTVGYNVSSGDHTLRWQYAKDGSLDRGADHGWVDQLQFNNLAAALDITDLVFTEPAGSSAPWFREVNDGNGTVPTGDIARSGAVSVGQRSDFETVIEGPAIVSFRMVQTGTSGEFRAQWGPNLGRSYLHTDGLGWRTYVVQLDDGSQTMRWSYYQATAGSGSGIVDELVVNPAPATLHEALNLSLSDYVPILEGPGLWIADDSSGGAPVDVGENDSVAVRTIATDNDRWAGLVHTVIGPGVCSFWWRASGDPTGELRLDYRSSIDGSIEDVGFLTSTTTYRRELAVLPIPGGTGWRQEFVEIPPGETQLQFTYTPGSADGAGWVDQIRMLPGHDVFSPDRGLDRWTSDWSSLGDAAWFGTYDDTNGGLDSATHGDLVNNQNASLSTTVIGPKQLHFDWKVSSEAGYDFFRLLLNGEDVIEPISGEVPWTSVVVHIPDGPQTLRWLYEKDVSVSHGEDRAWLDKVAILHPEFGVQSIEHGGTAYTLVEITKDSFPNFFLDYSTDLENWTQVGDMLTNPSENLRIISPYQGPDVFYQLRFEPELLHTIENPGFEDPAVPVNTFANNAPGWGPDNDAFTATSFEHIANFAASGTQHLSIAAGSHSQMTGGVTLYPGVHSITAAVGHRSGFTGSSNRTIVSLIEFDPREYVFASLEQNANNGPATADFWNSFPVSYEFFEDQTDFIPVRIRLESEGTRSFFDDIRIVSESQ